ncbi:hypothetical protein [Deinococcus soli (ex Cha et al. 2016)]|uniref:Uncharacterized protein n=2 Tax=Deinococcus soli (ex Cha et al. 2016) TaxID=1309411 RepID=A0ACC6KH47_9DEIO|nr:hypothetical protein [Deinococcus soli (ex Cha et al. 2016)]MDR6218932.1 hypothetical protein [Deinococcus soli (ex Cha et al. 2016)]MDR6328729.1 hypothetical protein [Deinococcus soli (ex Cha et al. 2016)]MDR6751784.1 hypothetical protein [Deinococcus soli (ex Cha et al. 2016)]
MTARLITRGLLETDATTVMVAYLTADGDVHIARERSVQLTGHAPALPAGPLWIHEKSRGLYAELTRGPCQELDARFVAYVSLQDGRVWFRPEENFMDGRFTRASIQAVQAHLN